MKLVRFGRPGEERPGLLDRQNHIRDLSKIITDVHSTTLNSIQEKLAHINIETLALVPAEVRLGACILPGKIMCIGYNSRLHTQQMGVKALDDSEMLVFLKPTSAVAGPRDAILYGRHNKKLDWEGELGVVIGKKGKYIEKQNAEQYIFGYICFHDLSDRYWQFETGDKQYTKGKGMDGFAPIGPYLVSKDEIKNASNLNVKLWVNNELRQDFNTSDYINDPAAAVSYLSQFFTLFPGDIIAMGSAPGNAKFWGEDKFLKIGDSIIFEIEQLGRQEYQVIKE